MRRYPEVLQVRTGGHAVWLATRNGRLAHRPAGERRELFAPRPFTWYLVDL